MRNVSDGKVAVVTPYYHPRVGGLENYARRSVQTLREAGFQVVVFTSAHEGRRRSIDVVDGVKVTENAQFAPAAKVDGLNGQVSVLMLKFVLGTMRLIVSAPSPVLLSVTV